MATFKGSVHPKKSLPKCIS